MGQAQEAGLAPSLPEEANGDGPLGGAGPSGLPSLVSAPHNSVILARHRDCENGRFLRGSCLHGTTRWRWVPCKRRDCSVCGPVGRWRIAERIALGVREFWPCAWLVLTLPPDALPGESGPSGRAAKRALVRRVGKFVRWLRRGDRWWPGLPGLQYAATYELTRAGRLHVNLICGPWSYVPQSALSRAWGGRVWVELVRDEGSVGREAAKASPEALGGYLSKLEQAVPMDRRVSFSKGWPKLPAVGLARRGELSWGMPFGDEELAFLWQKREGMWVERPSGCGEWQRLEGEGCSCFELAGVGGPAPARGILCPGALTGLP